MTTSLSCVLIAVAVLSGVHAQPSGYKMPEDQVCAYTVIGPCFAPEVADYMRLGDPNSVVNKLKADELRVVCNKVESAYGCLKKNVPKYCQLKSTDAFEETNDFVGLWLDHVCNKKYPIFNKAKTCLLSKMDEISSKLRTCPRINALANLGVREVTDSDVCKIFKDAGFTCLVKVLGEVCGTEYGNEVKSLISQASEKLFNCKNLSARGNSNQLASAFVRRALSLDPSETLEDILSLLR